VGKVDGDFAGGPPEELGRATGSGPGPSGRPGELDFEQAVGHEPVEVELGRVARNIQCFGGLVSVDRDRLGDDESVERPAKGIAERSDAADLGVVRRLDVGFHDCPLLKEKTLDEFLVDV